MCPKWVDFLSRSHLKLTTLRLGFIHRQVGDLFPSRFKIVLLLSMYILSWKEFEQGAEVFPTPRLWKNPSLSENWASLFKSNVYKAEKEQRYAHSPWPQPFFPLCRPSPPDSLINPLSVTAVKYMLRLSACVISFNPLSQSHKADTVVTSVTQMRKLGLRESL